MSAYRCGKVYICDEWAGIIRETDSGYEFAYRAEWLKRPDAAAVSLTLPLRSEPYRAETLFPFFDGLIPEGWLLNVVVDNWKLEKDDRFGLLLIACRDCIGNVSILEGEAE